MTKSRYRTTPAGKTYFVTSSFIRGLPLMSNPSVAQIVLDSLEFLHTTGRMELHAYVLMENHLHLIGTSQDLSGEMRKFKSFTARTILDLHEKFGLGFFLNQLREGKMPHKTGQLYQVWEEGFHPQLILDHAMLLQKAEYIHLNPVRRGYVDCAEHWRYSSCRQYLGKEGLIPIKPLV